MRNRGRRDDQVLVLVSDTMNAQRQQLTGTLLLSGSQLKNKRRWSSARCELQGTQAKVVIMLNSCRPIHSCLVLLRRHVCLEGSLPTSLCMLIPCP